MNKYREHALAQATRAIPKAVTVTGACRCAAVAAVRRILTEVCGARGVAEIDVTSRRMRPEYIAARREICARARAETAASFPEIGRVLQKDHTTVMHAVTRYEQIEGQLNGTT